ncbi:MAG TPA: DUF1800 family protein [Flavobacteriales bacterium]
MSLAPYSGPFGTEELRHLLRRTLFGCTQADLQHFEGDSLEEVLDALFDFSNDTTPPLKTYWELNGNTPDPTLVDPDVPFGATWVDTVRDPGLAIDPSGARIVSFLSWRTGLMAQQDRTLREKLVLFWHNHMPVNAFEVFVPEFVLSYDQLLRTNAKGNFRELMYEVTVNGAMLMYLNGYLNSAQAADENYARELMELFTLGEGSGYTESDVQAAARVLTGWTIRFQDGGTPILPETIFVPFLHSSEDKVFSPFFNNTVIAGQVGASAGPAELNALLDMIFLKEEVSLFICRELHRYFVHGEIDTVVEEEVIVPMAQLFRDHAADPDQMGIVLRALLRSEHFFSAQIRACMVKSPADLVVGQVRQTALPLPGPAQVEAQYAAWLQLYWLMGYCGQELMAPPNVAGWPAYYQYPQYDDIWMDTATYPARKNSLQGILYSGFSTDDSLYQPESRNLEFRVDLPVLVSQFSDPMDPNALVRDLAALFFALPLSTAVLGQLKTNFLLLGQQNDVYWSDAYELYMADPNTTNMTAQLVPDILMWLMLDMAGAAEIQLH